MSSGKNTDYFRDPLNPGNIIRYTSSKNFKDWDNSTGSGGDFIPTTEKGLPNGVATLDTFGRLNSNQMPKIDGGIF